MQQQQQQQNAKLNKMNRTIQSPVTHHTQFKLVIFIAILGSFLLEIILKRREVREEMDTYS